MTRIGPQQSTGRFDSNLVIFAPFNNPPADGKNPHRFRIPLIRILLPATLTRNPRKLAAIGMPHAELITVNDALEDNLFATPANLDESMIEELLHTFESQLTIIFTSSIIATNRLCRLLQLFSSELQSVRGNLRGNMRDLAQATGISNSTLCRALKNGVISRRSSTIKPPLTNANKLERLAYCGAHPPNSPDLNVLDLGFFASIQTLQYKMFSRTVDDVIASTMMAFDSLDAEILENLFLTLQVVMRLVLVHGDGNQLKLPHLKKGTMKRAGALAVKLSCPVFAVNSLLQAASP
ncbi:hypothetical protein H310_08569 [Aphanomyces invadans]|uniref:Uncharacterized protein n=1 Tax=Aphanomyces invadans TaxID=157072 RepID=A0A024TYC7_9STRA|nr:hypothetical protein H310_08569 [Aphanomyces invadans]ETV99170.1 hypothetical protein H310_08569 [Aphanomyces invadans]|eukprot:XP_008872598.1 hypothetical protein H310_08569 [Aphanomyces invadans]